MAAPLPEGAGIEPDGQRRRGPPRRRDEIDRAAQRAGAIFERTAAPPDFNELEGQRIDRLKIPAAIGEVQRNAVLVKLDTAKLKATLNA